MLKCFVLVCLACADIKIFYSRVVRKPSSVVGSYLSSCKIALAIEPSFEVMCRANNPSFDVAANRVYMAGNVSTPSVSSYLAFPPLPKIGGISLLHFP